MKHVILVTRLSRVSEIMVDPTDGLPFNTARAAAEAVTEDAHGEAQDPIVASELMTLSPATQADTEAFERHLKKIEGINSALEDAEEGEGLTEAAQLSCETFHTSQLPAPLPSVESFITYQEEVIDSGA